MRAHNSMTSGMAAVSRREYKVMLDHRLFAERKQAAAELWSDLQVCANRLHVRARGNFAKTEKRQIVFLDTIDHAVYLNHLVFRQRVDLEHGSTEYTLKCRSPDRYVAAGAEIDAAKRVKGKLKFEEDICSPFVSRFSRSNTVRGPKNPPTSLRKAAKLFPALADLTRDGVRCWDKLKLEPVNSLVAYERVLTGPRFEFDGTDAEVALILWSEGPKGRPLVAEFSFRYANDDEVFATGTARSALDFFSEIQVLDWCQPEGPTKTRYVYGNP